MSYTPTDNYSTTTTALLPIGAITMPLANSGNLCLSSSVSPAYVQIQSAAGTETLTVTGCALGLPTIVNITPTLLQHASGAKVCGFNIPAPLICAIVRSACGFPTTCDDLTVI